MIDLSKEIGGILSDYSAEVAEAMQKSVEEVTKKTVKKLKASKSMFGGTGKYAQNWTSDVEKGHVTVSAVIYGKAPTYRLAHLLEHGHAKRGGGRTRPIIHIKPVEEWAIDEVQRKLKEKVESL